MSAPAISTQFRSSSVRGKDAGVPTLSTAFPASNRPELCEVLPFRSSQPSRLDWMTRMYQLVARKEIDDALEILYDELLDLQTAGRFAECNEMLALLDVDGLDTNLMVGVLVVTYQAKDRLSHRARILKKIERRLAELAPNRIEALIGNLR